MLLVAVTACAGELEASNPSEASGARWLAGDHHIHSRFSVGWDKDVDPPTPYLGGDAIYPIPMNALMARRFGLAWMVTTDHGGPNHSRVHREHAYPELLVSRESVPEVVQFFGMELNTPGADHSTWILPRTDDELERLVELETRFDTQEVFPEDPARDDEARMLEALERARQLSPLPVVIANHPSRSAKGLSVYDMDQPAELRRWNDTAPEVAVGMEGAPGHQAAGLWQETWAKAQRKGIAARLQALGMPVRLPRGAYWNHPTYGGFDQMTARLGGFWDAMLGEGRRWWITATSDSHVHLSDGGIDFWPGEYSKTYVFAEHEPAAILEGLRAGRVFVTTGDLVAELSVVARRGDEAAGMGGTLEVPRGARVELEVAFLDPETPNANGDRPRVRRVDLITGRVAGAAADPAQDENASTAVARRFEAGSWREGATTALRHVFEDVRGDFYVRVRGTSTQELEPTVDTPGEDPWQDLWFYSNPVFVKIR